MSPTLGPTYNLALLLGKWCILLLAVLRTFLRCKIRLEHIGEVENGAASLHLHMMFLRRTHA